MELAGGQLASRIGSGLDGMPAITVVLKASRKMTLEEMLEYCERDELVEVTPESLRLRKKLLKEAERRREARHEEARKAGATS